MANIEIPCDFASGCTAEKYVHLIRKNDRTPKEEERLEGYRAQLALLPGAVCNICPVRSVWSDLFDNQ